MRKLLMVCILMLGCAIISMAQTGNEESIKKELIKMPVPPSPNAAALGKFGDIPVGLSTGIPSISIPFYNYTDPDKKLTLPVGLSYHAGGHRVEDMASNVGLGWALNAGGAISRTLRGLPDEGLNGYWSTPALPAYNTHFTGNSFDVATLGTSEGITYYNDINTFHKAQNILDRLLDGEADIFNFNAGELSGKFFIDKSGNVHLFSRANIEITRNGTTGFVIKDRNTSVTYFFDITESIYISNPNDSFNDIMYTSSWYLSKIISADKKDTITFTYASNGDLLYESGFSSHYQVRAHSLNKVGESFTQSWNNTTVYGALRIQSIVFPEKTEVQFAYTFPRADYTGDYALTTVKVLGAGFEKRFELSYDYFINDCSGGCGSAYSPNDNSKRLKLTQVQESDGVKSLPPYSFEYNATPLPARNSGFKDSWGYYSKGGSQVPHTLNLQSELSALFGKDYFMMFTQGEAVEAYTKACILEKLIYPTGGHTKFTYGINDGYSGQYNISSKKGNVFFNQSEINVTKSLNFTGRNTQDMVDLIFIISPISAQPPPNGNQTPQPTMSFTITSTDGTVSHAVNIAYDWTYKYSTHSLSLPVGKSYQVSFSQDFYNNETYDISMGYSYGIVPINRTIGGLRVQKTEDYSAISNPDGTSSAPVIAKYIYEREDGKSSGRLQHIPNYDMYKTYIRQYASGDFSVSWIEQNFNQSSQPVQTLSNFRGSPVIYTRVKVDKSIDGNPNGYAIHEFTGLISSEIQGVQYPFVQRQDLDWKQGLPTKEFYYDKNNNLLRFIENEYNYYDVTQVSDGARQMLAALVFYDSHSTMQEKVYAARSYHLVTGRSELKRTTEELYHGSQKIVNITEYEYDLNKYLLVKKRQKGNLDVWDETRYYYPHNYSLAGLPWAVAQFNGDAELVSQENWKQKGTSWFLLGSLVNEYSSFNNVIRKNIVNKSELIQPLNLAEAGVFNPDILKRHSSIKEQVRIVQYDEMGRLLEVKAKENINSSLIWGGDKRYPVAQITNAAPLEVFYNSFEEGTAGTDDVAAPTGTKSYAGNYTVNFTLPQGATRQFIVTYWSFNGSSWSFNKETYAGAGKVLSGAKIDEVRVYPADAQMTTYTYRPMLGMTSQCDINNHITYYEYDGLGRLSLIRDKDRNILKKFCYNYQGQLEDCGIVDTAPLWQSTGTTQCKPCAGNTSYNTNILQQQEKDNNPNSTTYNQTRWMDVGVSTSCIVQADWQNTATGLRCKVVNGIYSGEQEQEQKDMNPCSPSAYQLRWVIVGINCTVCPKPQVWQATGNYRCVKDASLNNTGEQEREERNTESCSNGYNTTRWVSNGTNCTSCAKVANWQATGNYRCVKDASGNNTGYQEREERDMEGCSGTYNQTRWVNNGYNTSACPLPSSCHGGNCYGEDKKCVNGSCEPGLKVYTYSYYDDYKGYVCVYHYEWSDATWSQDYEEYNSGGYPCFIF